MGGSATWPASTSGCTCMAMVMCSPSSSTQGRTARTLQVRGVTVTGMVMLAVLVAGTAEVTVEVIVEVTVEVIVEVTVEVTAEIMVTVEVTVLVGVFVIVLYVYLSKYLHKHPVSSAASYVVAFEDGIYILHAVI